MSERKESSWTIAVLSLAAFIVLFGSATTFCQANAGPRHIINLDGTWEIAEGSTDSVPKSFEHKVPVPGLVDMAKPGFSEVGKKSEKRQAFWYRRTFKVEGEIPDVAILKIHKAKYSTKVFLNDQLVGEHLPCFTPALLDVKKFLRGSGQENELIIRVGANRESVPEGQPAGWDFEKYLYIPGIYDSVELIVTGSPYIKNVQTIPDISRARVRVVTELQCPAPPSHTSVSYELCEASNPKFPYILRVCGASLPADQTTKLDVVIPIEDCKLWTPEEPFLYQLLVRTAGDSARVRFGMRSFRFDKETGRAVLNGKPYFMRGTNVCVYRFFEDAERGDKPWRKEWVRRLHRKFKSMHWNSIRYCIGFPPEIWYDIADEEGFLIQDEFPIWFLGKENWPKALTNDAIAKEYTEWMQERWNHPCVVIWDAQNETVTDETGKAIAAVRGLDLSCRPWENGWAEPQSLNDCVESHPYLFSKTFFGNKPFLFKDIANVSGKPHLRSEQKKLGVPVVINEYAWLWLNRDGTPTCLTDKVYNSLLGPNSTVEQRRLLYARYLAALTEFWRCHRECAGVLHFCGLGYSRPGDKPRPEGGATSDHFINLEKLDFEPNFERLVRDAFSPVGLMIDFWDEEIAGGTKCQFNIFVINDLCEDWEGAVSFRIVRDGKKVAEQSKPCKVGGLGREVLTFEQVAPKRTGDYQIIAELDMKGTAVRSLRDFKVVADTK